MHIVKLRKIENSIAVTLPESVIEALHLQENDDITIEIAGDQIVLMRSTPAFQTAWDAYQKIEPYYHDANNRLAARPDRRNSGE